MLQREDQLVGLFHRLGPEPQQLFHASLFRTVIGRLWGPLLAEEAQVIDERHTAARRDGPDLVDAVGIEGREADLRRLLGARVEHHLPAEMPYDQFAATVGRGQHEDQRCEHARDLFRVPVADEEAALIVDEELVELGRDRLGHTEAGGRAGDEFGQSLVPVTPADPYLSGIDLPGFPNLAIDHRLLAPSIGGCLSDCDQPLGLDGQQRKSDPAHAVDLDRRHEDLSKAADTKIARPLDRTKAIRQGSTDRRHGGSRQAGDRNDVLIFAPTGWVFKKLCEARARARNRGHASPGRRR